VIVYADRVSTETDESKADGGTPPPPTSEQVTQGAMALLDEVDEAFRSDKWAILDSGREHATWLLYDGAIANPQVRVGRKLASLGNLSPTTRA
jgi:hypothetical protein